MRLAPRAPRGARAPRFAAHPIVRVLLSLIPSRRRRDEHEAGEEGDSAEWIELGKSAATKKSAGEPVEQVNGGQALSAH